MAQLKDTTVNGTLSATTFSGPGGNITGFNTSLIGSQLSQSIATSGTVINRTDYTNSTRIGLSNASSYTIYSFNITKLQAGSSLWIKGIMPIAGGDATVTTSGVCMYVGIDGALDFTGIGADNLDSQGCGVMISQLRTGIAAGTRTITIGWSSQDGSGHRLANSVNQNTSDTDARNRQNGSVITVWEII